MTISTVFLQAGTANAQDLRLINSSVIGDEGVVTGLTVTANNTRTLTIAAGSAFVPTTIGGEGGYYHVQNVSASTYVVPTGTTGVRYLQLQVLGTGGVTFTDSASQSSSYITLASFPVTSTGNISAASVSSSATEYARMSYSLVPQSIRVLSTARPTQDLVYGMRIYETDTTLTRQYTQGGVWEYIAGDMSAGGTKSKVISQNALQQRLWKVTYANAVIRGGVVQGQITFEYTRANVLTVPSSGNIGNQDICTILDPWRPSITTRATPLASGRLITGSINSAGLVSVTSMASGSDVVQGETFTLGWSYPIRSI